MSHKHNIDTTYDGFDSECIDCRVEAEPARELRRMAEFETRTYSGQRLLLAIADEIDRLRGLVAGQALEWRVVNMRPGQPPRTWARAESLEDAEKTAQIARNEGFWGEVWIESRPAPTEWGQA